MYLVVGDNGQLGINVCNYFITKYTDVGEIEESLFVNINGVNWKLDYIYEIMSDDNIIIFVNTVDIYSHTFYVLHNTGYLDKITPGAD